MSAVLSEELLAILADPETHDPVSLATDEQLATLRARIAEGTARRRDGGDIPDDFEAALLSQNDRVAYLVTDGVPNFLIDDRIELDSPL